MSRRKQRGQQEAPEGNKKDIQFVLQRLKIYKEHVKFYQNKQDQIEEADLKLLKPKSNEKDKGLNNNDEDDDEDNSNKEYELLRRVNQIKQQVELIKKVGTQVEKDLFLNEEENKKNLLSEEQIKEAQLKAITEEQTKYRNLVFNMDYQLDLHQDSRRRYRRETEYDCEKQFELEINQKSYVTIYAYSKASFHTWIQNFTGGKSEVEHLNLYIHRLETEADFYAFDDFAQTIKLGLNSYSTVNIDVQFDNNLCVLALLRFLITLDRFNILNITSSYSRNKYNFEEISDVLESIFKVVFSHRNLQGVKLQIPQETFKYLVSSTRNINLQKSKLSVFSFSTELKLVDVNLVQEYFNFLQKFPNLTHYNQSSIPVSGSNAIENLNVLLKKLSHANLNLVSVPSSFNFEFYFVNLQYLKLDFGLEPNILTNQKLENLLLNVKQSSKLQFFKLNFYTYVPEETSRKDILKQAQTIKSLKNNKNQEETPETKDATPAENTSGMKFFDHLSELTNLEEFSATLQSTQEIYDSLHRLLVRSSNLKKFYANIKYEKAKEKMDKFIDLKNIYETLNNLKKCNAHITTPHGSIVFSLSNKDSSLYIFKLSLNQDLNHAIYTFKQNEFKFDNAKSINITSPNFENLEDLNTICKSLASCQKLQNLKLIASYSNISDKHKAIQRQPFNKPDLPFFKQFESLKLLENVYIESLLDQHILNSISAFLENNQTIKSFIFKRQYLAQYYLDYTKLFKNLQNLPQLNQVYFNQQLEELTVSETHKQSWENHKLKAFIEPLCEFIKESSKNVQLIDLDQNEASDDVLKKILQTIVESKHHHYIRFNPTLSNNLSKSENEDIQEFLKTCDEKGVLVKAYFKFPLCQPTGAYYDYNQNVW